MYAPIPPGYKLLGTTVSGPFMSAIQIGIIGGLIAAFSIYFLGVLEVCKARLIA